MRQLSTRNGDSRRLTESIDEQLAPMQQLSTDDGDSSRLTCSNENRVESLAPGNGKHEGVCVSSQCWH